MSNLPNDQIADDDMPENQPYEPWSQFNYGSIIELPLDYLSFDECERYDPKYNKDDSLRAPYRCHILYIDNGYIIMISEKHLHKLHYAMLINQYTRLRLRRSTELYFVLKVIDMY